MKRFKSLVFVLACALFFVGAMGITKASAADSAITEKSVNYADEKLEVVADSQVYYQVVKTESGSGLKAANWIKAAEDSSTGAYWIDFSATSNAKTAYIALSLDNEATSGEVVKIEAKIKSIKPLLKYSAEYIGGLGLDGILSGIEIKGIDSSLTTKKGEPATADTCKLIWKRGANGTWTDEDGFLQVHWDMLKASNGTLYISMIGAGDEQVNVYDYRASKEAKVKIPKTAKAPSVKIDYAKGTIALKNGMQVSADETKWLTIALYDKSATAETVYVTDATAKTKTKVSSVTIGDFVDAVNANYTSAGLSGTYGSDVEATLYVRTAATDKKFPSASTKIEFNTPDVALTAKSGDKIVPYTVAEKEAKITADMVINLADFITETEYANYEYLLLDNTITETGVNLAKVKWTKVPTDGKIDLSSKIGKTYKYTKLDGASVTKKYEESQNLVIRVMADKEEEVFASKILQVAFTTEKVAYFAVQVEASNATYEVTIGEGTAKKAKAGDTVKVTYTVDEGYQVTGSTVATGAVEDSIDKSKDGVITFVVADEVEEIEVVIQTAKKSTGSGED